MFTEDNTFDFFRQINGLEYAVNTFYNYFRYKNILVDESYINCFDEIINTNDLSEFFHDEQIIPTLKNYENNNFEIESNVVEETIDSKTKITNLPIKVNTKYKSIDKKYSCKKCGKLYANTDAVRKHWRKKHNEFELKRGKIHSYTTIIFQTEKTYDVDKTNECSDYIDLTCNELLEY